MEKYWSIQSFDYQKCIALQKDLEIKPIYCQLLLHRNILTAKEAKRFFNPDSTHLHDPFMMKGMQAAVERISRAIQKKENILVYGDYDVDGTTAVATVYSFLCEQFPEINSDFYIPDRYHEGYGISQKGIDYAKNENFSLIIVLDCGIKAFEEIAYAHSLGIDVIVCDHHRPGELLPEAFAILNPKQKDCHYPYKELSGCGIGFKLISALAGYFQLPTESAERYLDLVLTSIVADVVPMTGENRVLASIGLKKIHINPLPGIRILMHISGIKKKPSVEDILFMIAPRINAAGRLKDAALAVNLFVEKNPERATAFAQKLHELNEKRKTFDKEITEDILLQINSDPLLQNRKTTVVVGASWHKGVIGIAASRVMETYYRPTIVFSESNGMLTGSARSVKGFNIYHALTECSALLERFGGHDFAAGMTLKQEFFENFSQKFESIVSQSITEEHLTPGIEIDAELSFSDLTERFYNTLQRFAPFGPGNRQPVFLLTKVRDNGFSKIISGKHIRFEIIHYDYPNQSFAGIGFNLSKKFDIVASGNLFDLCFCLQKNEYAGNSPLQLRVLDIRAYQNE